MEYKELFYYLQNVGKDPARLIFEDELTGLYNRRFLYNYLQQNVKWDSLAEHPVSLLMIDLDNFKEINDAHGHDAGDQALVHVARLVREAAGEKYLSIRYAGDEFMIVLPEEDKYASLGVGEKIIQLVRRSPFPVDEHTELAITMSIGVASAPLDARDYKTLIQKADTALYYAKKAGRDRLANVGDIPLQDVFVKTALNQLERARIAGRKPQFAAVAEALKKFSQRQSQFLVTEGTPGMGKSVFMDTIQKSVAQSKSISHVKVAGTPQELFRPYYLMSHILVALLNLKEDKGESLLGSLSPSDHYYLSPILPQLRKEAGNAQYEDEKTFREGVFKTLISLTYKLVDSKPIVILIDDLHFCDEATLLLLRQMILKREVPVFICGTRTDTPKRKGEDQHDTLARFLTAYGREINVQTVLLPPLNEVDITNHLRGVFRGMNPPKNFAKELEQITQGNPLFLSEIVRRLVIDGRITLSGQQWIVQPLEKGYLPRSLEEIVRQKISALDEESRRLLDQASIFGDRVSLSALTGSADISEARILDFLDNAVSQRLISSDFQMNDENIRFLSRRVLDITYGGIQKDQRQELHERVGAYQESLYERDLLPSAATLAYHFKRSANQNKARSYEQIQSTYNSAVFSAAEATSYVVEDVGEGRPKETPLDAESMTQVPRVFRSLLLAVRNIRLYPSGSKSVIITNRQAYDAIDKILQKNDLLSIFQSERALTINGDQVDISEFRAFADSFMRTMELLELRGIVFKKGLKQDDWTMVVEAFGRSRTEEIEKGFWQRFLAKKRIEHLELVQVKYELIVEGTALEPKKGVQKTVSDEDMAVKLNLDALSYVPEFTRSFLSVASCIRLYTLNSKATESAVDQLMQALRRILRKHPAITMAKVGDHLFVNDEKVDIADFEFAAKGFLKFVDSIGLKSISFLRNVSKLELKAFLGALGQLPPSGLNSNYWRRLAKDQGISRVLFDERFYETKLPPVIGDSNVLQFAHAQKRGAKPAEASVQQREDAMAEAPLEALLDSMSLRMSDLLLKGDERKIREIIRGIFRGYLGGATSTKLKVIARSQGLMEGLSMGLQNQMAKLLASPLLLVLSKEEDPKVLEDLGSFIYNLANLLIQFAEYPIATRIFLHLHRRCEELQSSDGRKRELLGQALVRPLEPKVQQLIEDDFRSKEPSRQQSAAQLLGGLGQVTIPLLIEIIKSEEDLRIRRLAASLLAELGNEAAKQLKKQLVLQTTSEERLRILEVIDGVTRDLITELTDAIHDESRHVRNEAIRLAERLNSEERDKLLLDCVESEKTDVAVKAIKSLGRLCPAVALEKILSFIMTAKEEKRLVACCQTLGQIGDPESIEVLTRILSAPRFMFLGKKFGAEVRASAALALTQMDDPQVTEILAKFVNDKNPRVSGIARSRALPLQELLERNTRRRPFSDGKERTGLRTHG